MALNYVNYIPSTRCLSSLKCVYGFSLCADSEAWSAFKPSGRDRSICCCFYRFLSISLPPVPNRERSSPFLAQLSRQLNIGIDFQSSASVAKLAEGLSSTVSSVTTLHASTFDGGTGSIRSIPRQFCAGIVQSCRNLRFLGRKWRMTRIKYRT